MTFYVGQKVVCVDDSPWRNIGCRGYPMILRRGAIYTIVAISTGYSDAKIGLHFAEIRDLGGPRYIAGVPGGPRGYDSERFRPVVEKKTDISMFEEILRRETIDDRERVS